MNSTNTQTDFLSFSPLNKSLQSLHYIAIKHIRPFLLLFAFAISLSLSAQTKTYYVDAAKANNDGDGLSWDTAKKDLQLVIDTASKGDEIRVAFGTYYPTDAPDNSTDDPRDRAFHLNKNVILKGGYNPTTNEQDYSNPTILSGDIGVSGDNTDNAYHVLITAKLSSATTIDGFTFSGGNANASAGTILNYSTQEFYKNTGAGMYNTSSSPTITNSIFRGNTADVGGGMLNQYSSATMTNCTFSRNYANYWGGGMYNSNTSFSFFPTITNSIFSGNNAAAYAGGLYNYFSSTTIINSIFIGNTATTKGGGMHNISSTPTLYNTVLYANTAPTGSDINGNAIDESSSHNASDGTGGSINLGTRSTGFVDLSTEENPFIDSIDPDGADNIFGTADDGLVPSGTSPLIDAGDNTKNNEETDITGGTRILGTAIDIGAYEHQVVLHRDGSDVETLTIHPNPITDVLNIELDGGMIEQVFIYSLSGENIMSQKMQGGNKQQLDISNLVSGVYIISIRTDRGSSQQKLVVQ